MNRSVDRSVKNRVTMPATGYLLVGVIIVAIAVVSIVWLGNPFKQANSPQGPLPPQLTENPVSDMPGNAEQALAVVVGKINYQLKLPSYFPTSADRLQWANYGSHPHGGPQPAPVADVMYLGSKTVTVGGEHVRPSLEIQYSGSLRDAVSADGDLVSTNLAHYIVYRRVTYKGADGTPVMVRYIALHAPVSMALTFTGEIPTTAELEKMLTSFVPVAVPGAHPAGP